MANPVTVDNTILSAVNTCDLKAGLRHVLHLTSKEERLELEAGSAIHEALAVWHKGGTATSALAAFDGYYKAFGSKVSAEERLSYSNVYRILKRLFANFATNALPYTVQKDLVEAVFEDPLDDHGDYVIIGRIDQVVAYQGRLVIGENKTTGSLSGYWKDKWPLSSQLTTYVYGGKYGMVDGQPLGLPIEEAIVFGLELRKVPTSESKCRDHKLPYRECGDLHVKWEFSGPHPLPDGFLQRWRKDALAAAKRFQWMKENIHTVQDAADKLEQQGQFNGSCVWCEFKDYCRQGVPAAQMEANLTKHEWDPRNVKHGPLTQIDKPCLPVMRSPSQEVPISQPTVPVGREGVLVGTAPIPPNARRL